MDLDENRQNEASKVTESGTLELDETRQDESRLEQIDQLVKT